MNNNIDRTNTLIGQNADAIEKSTATVHANIQAVEGSTALIEKNRAVMEALFALMPTMPIKLGVLLLVSFLFLPSLLVTFSIKKFEKKLEQFLKK